MTMTFHNATIARSTLNALRMPARLSCKALAAVRGPRKIVLAYHSIGHAHDAVTAEQFREQMAYLRDNATVMSLDRLLATTAPDRRLSCAITFDDGYAGLYTIAYPILKACNFPATAYVTTSAMGLREPQRSDECQGFFPNDWTLTWSQLAEMSSDIFTVGSHLCRHFDMRSISAPQGIAELSRSREIISDLLQKPCDHFAYPFGYFNRQCIEWVKQCGYKTAVTVMNSSVPKRYKRYEIPRMCIGPVHRFQDFLAMINGEFDYLPIVQRVRFALGLTYS